MSTIGENQGIDLNAVSDGVIRVGRFAKASDAVDGGFEECDTAGEGAQGVAWQASVDGGSVRIVNFGRYPVESGDAFSVGDLLATDNQGRAVEAGAGDQVLGTAAEAAGAAAEFVFVNLCAIPASTPA
jgi:hypothetical protein